MLNNNGLLARISYLLTGKLPVQESKTNDVLLCLRRDVTPFHGIALNSSVDVHWTIGNETSVHVFAPEHLHNRILIDVSKDGVLVIDGKDNLFCRSHLRVQVVSPVLRSAVIVGSGDIRADGLAGEEFVAEIEGSGDMFLRGSVQRLTATLSGSGDIEAKSLIAQQVQADIQGSGDIEVTARQEFKGSIFGSGDIEVYGSPALRAAPIFGSGSVTFKK